MPAPRGYRGTRERTCEGDPGEDVIKALRWIGASLLGLVGGVLGLVGAVLCVTIVLAPLGIPILFLAKRLFRTAGQLVVPRGVRHPIDTIAEAASDKSSDLGKTARKSGRRATRKATKKAKKVKRSL